MGLRSRITSEAIILIGGIGVTGECAVRGEKMNPVVGIDVAKDDHWGNYSCCESSYLFYYKSICQTLNFEGSSRDCHYEKPWFCKWDDSISVKSNKTHKRQN
ncbi:hypothetical protein H131_05968 [Lysinibacillus sphaericus OT4b.31]|uniref:Uncharacterized protein n=1 Tax=Lysinibacillus sphaericus OT4b.31 TaxID=1285586 RepID=R7ZHG0_LYSSH|nr:hypothetical protein H131_05968 [Lysinibacillus sphaericus OT4b.31]